MAHMKIEEAWNMLGQMPHCDARILHAPGACEFCDAKQQWQAYRVAMGINFTGDSDPEKLPCPSEKFRTPEQAQRWYGNRPYPKSVWIVTPDYYGTFTVASVPYDSVKEGCMTYGSEAAAKEVAASMNSRYK